MYWQEYDITYRKRKGLESLRQENASLQEFLIMANERENFTAGPPRKTLELGCGIGQMTQFLTDHCLWVTGIDISPTAISEARKLYADSSSRFICQNLCDLNFENEFELAFDSHALHCIVYQEERDLCLHNIFKALKPGGLFLVESMVRNSRTAVDENTYLDPQGIFWKIASEDFLRIQGKQDMEMIPARRIQHAIDLEEELKRAGFAIEYLMVHSEKKIIPSGINRAPLQSDPDLMRVICRRPE